MALAPDVSKTVPIPGTTFLMLIYIMNQACILKQTGNSIEFE